MKHADLARVDETMTWQGGDYDPASASPRVKPWKVCMQRGDRRFSDLAVWELGDRERWRDIYELNNLSPCYKVRLGDCFLLPAK